MADGYTKDSECRPIESSAGEPRRSRIPRTSGKSLGVEREIVFQRVNIDELVTEEHIQREKLREAAAIEVGVSEIKEVTDEFAALLQHQQAGIDGIVANVDAAARRVNSGRGELSTAGRRQGCCRNVLCLMAFALSVTLAVIIVTVLLLKR